MKTHTSSSVWAFWVHHGAHAVPCPSDSPWAFGKCTCSSFTSSKWPPSRDAHERGVSPSSSAKALAHQWIDCLWSAGIFDPVEDLPA